jgi:hypothetical protein
MRELSRNLALTVPLLGVVVLQFVGGLPRVVALGVFSAFS